MTNWDLNLNLLEKAFRIPSHRGWNPSPGYKTYDSNRSGNHRISGIFTISGQISKWLWTTGGSSVQPFSAVRDDSPHRHLSGWNDQRSLRVFSDNPLNDMKQILRTFDTLYVYNNPVGYPIHKSRAQKALCFGWLCLVFVGIYILCGLLKPDPGFRIGYAA